MKPIIEVTDLSFAYPDGHSALSDISLSIGEGDAVGIIGPNGAGKSTLLLHLNGILRSKTSVVTVDGFNINNGHLKEVRQKIGFLFQEPDDQLFMPTVAEDIAFGPLNMGRVREEISALVKESLNEVDLKGFEGRSSHHLSIGEKKRVALASVLAMRPKILILDEPTANLDPRTRREFIKLVQGLKVTKIIASHDLAMIRDITKYTIVLSQGKKVAEDKTENILNNQFLLESFGF